MAMVADHAANSRPGFVSPLAGIAGRVAGSALRPVTGTMRIAVGVCRSAERRVVERVLSGGELKRVANSALDDARVKDALRRAFDRDGAGPLIDSLFDRGLIDYFIERLAASDALSRLVDDIAHSPAVRAALSQQGLGYAGQVGGAARERSPRADHRTERAAGRLQQHSVDAGPADPAVRGR